MSQRIGKLITIYNALNPSEKKEEEDSQDEMKKKKKKRKPAE